jgi:hypothetical protein
MQGFLDAELAHHLQVRARSSCFGKDVSAIVGEEAHGLGPAGVNAEYMHA